MWETLIRAIRLVPKPLRRRWAALAPMAVFSALLEAAAAGGILALIQLISLPDARTSGLVRGLREALGGDERTFLLRFALALAAFFAAKNLFRLGEAYWQHRVAAETGIAMSARLIRGYLDAPYAMHLRRNSAELVHLITRQLSEVWIVLQAGVSLASETLVVLAVIGVLVASAPWAAVVVALFLGGMLAGVLRLTYVWHGRWGRELHAHGIAFMKAVQESLGSVKEIKTLGRQERFVERVREARALAAEPDVKRLTSEMIPRLSVETVFVGGLALLIWSASGGESRLTATLGLMAYAGLRLLPSMQLIIYRAERISLGRAGVDAAWQDLTQIPAEPDYAGEVKFERSIELRDVGFTYEGAERPALEGLSFEIRRGESIGVVGPTGAGKSTLIDLLLGLLSPTTGSITIDGSDLGGRERAWRRRLGYVPQSVTLIDDTIRRNIALGLADEQVDEARVRDAVQTAQLEDFVAALPGGLDTIVGERGVRLSGGERQRMAVARALYGQPDVLVFDEATAALDNRTEQALTETIERLHGRKTMLLIAHRLTTVQRCDRLVYLEKGRLADIGSYGELMERNEAFRAMAAPAEGAPNRAKSPLVPEKSVRG